MFCTDYSDQILFSRYPETVTNRFNLILVLASYLGRFKNSEEQNKPKPKINILESTAYTDLKYRAQA